jgi:hypothetical protein
MDFLYKICKKCSIEKKLEEFHKDTRTKDGHEGGCKDCKKKYQEENKERIRENKKLYYVNNIEKLEKYRLEYNSLNKDKVSMSNKKWKDKNKEYMKEKSKEYYKNLSDEQKETKRINTKRWLDENKEHVRIKKNEYKKGKIKNDIIFALKHNINTLILLKLRNNGYTKDSRTHEILGCSFEEFKQYIESKFETWMKWNNRGLYNGEFNYGWDIDHIIPISSGKTKEEIIQLNHYTNLQPLCSKINRDIKKDKI